MVRVRFNNLYSGFIEGIGVPQSCEGALVWYRRVADRVAEDVTLGSPVITRVRLQDQFENPNFFSSLFDQDLIQYFQFIADKGKKHVNSTSKNLMKIRYILFVPTAESGEEFCIRACFSDYPCKTSYHKQLCLWSNEISYESPFSRNSNAESISKSFLTV